jgi:hypothetical protein
MALGAAGLAAASLLAGPAMAGTAHTAHPAAASIIPRFDPGDGFIMGPYLSTDGQQIQTNALGEQVTTGANIGTSWNTTAATTGYKIMPNGNSGHCLEQDGTDVDIQNCAAGNSKQWWIFSGASTKFSMKNVSTGQYMGVFDPNSVRPVYSEDQHTGFYVNWAVAS